MLYEYISAASLVVSAAVGVYVAKMRHNGQQLTNLENMVNDEIRKSALRGDLLKVIDLKLAPIKEDVEYIRARIDELVKNAK